MASIITRLLSTTLQEEIDLWRLYHMVHYFELCEGKNVKVPKPPKSSLRQQRKRIEACITTQVITLFSMLAVPSTAEKLLKDSPPTVCVASSEEQIPGCIMNRRAVPGSVLCFFPGIVYYPSELRFMPNYPDLSLHNPFLMARLDRCVIDAKEYQLGSELIRKQPYAVGHFLRHPPEGKQWNVLPYSYNLPKDFPPELLHWVPNRYFREPSFFQTKQLKTIVFVAAKHIEHKEELFLNYRLFPQSQLPSWYKEVNREEDTRRWK